jgi:hypothetical protein
LLRHGLVRRAGAQAIWLTPAPAVINTIWLYIYVYIYPCIQYDRFFGVSANEFSIQQTNPSESVQISLTPIRILTIEFSSNIGHSLSILRTLQPTRPEEYPSRFRGEGPLKPSHPFR